MVTLIFHRGKKRVRVELRIKDDFYCAYCCVGDRTQGFVQARPVLDR